MCRAATKLTNSMLTAPACSTELRPSMGMFVTPFWFFPTPDMLILPCCAPCWGRAVPHG